MPVRFAVRIKDIFILAVIVLDVQSGPKSNFFLPFMGTVTRLRKLKPHGEWQRSVSVCYAVARVARGTGRGLAAV